MARLSDLQPVDIRKIAIPVGDDALNLEVDASALTIGWQTRVNAAAQAEDVDAFAHEFFALVKKWDLEDDDGDIYPLDTETIHALTLQTLMKIVTAISGQIDPNAETPRKSRKR